MIAVAELRLRPPSSIGADFLVGGGSWGLLGESSVEMEKNNRVTPMCYMYI